MNGYAMNAGLKKTNSDWQIEGPSAVDLHSVISANHYASPIMKKDLS